MTEQKVKWMMRLLFLGWGLFIINLLLLGSVFAQETTLPPTIIEGIVSQDEIIEAGITPDLTLFWRIELVIDRIRETVNPEVILNNSLERAIEVRVTLNKGKIQYAELGIAEFNKSFYRIKNRTLAEERLGLERRLVDNLGRKVSIIASQGNLSEQDRASIKTLIEEHRNMTREQAINKDKPLGCRLMVEKQGMVNCYGCIMRDGIKKCKDPPMGAVDLDPKGGAVIPFRCGITVGGCELVQ